ncbi:helix-turn-helix domain-containing protein [Desulfovibrio sp. OttesenSCG-928-I05]|nr:helix-turn-helix domain-containing protein [Desulfovibrio sp. OttesenSCG-928-I05]
MEKVENLSWALAWVIKEARESAGLTQSQLAGFAGLSEIYLSSLERGCRGDSINALMQIAGVLNIPTSELMRRIEEELKKGPRQPEKTAGRPRKQKD